MEKENLAAVKATKEAGNIVISPALRHAPQLDYATEKTAIMENLSQEEIGFIDALDLARWLNTSQEKTSTKAGLFWGAIQWMATEKISLKGPDRNEEALLLLAALKNSIPKKQISQSTLNVYEASLKAMYFWSQKKRALDDESTAFVDALIAASDMLEREDLSDRAKWNYRSALLWHLELNKNPTKRDLQAKELLHADFSMPTKNKRKQGSVIAEKDLQQITAYLERKALAGVGSVAALTNTWIAAGLATGVRPVEWLDARWIDQEKKVLEVITAKTKVGKVGFINEDYDGLEKQAMQKTQVRRIRLLDEDEQAAVERMLTQIELYVPPHEPRAVRQAALNKLYLSVKHRLYTACVEIFGGKKIYSLYAFRRQFSANAKAAVGPEATAQLMGHTWQGRSGSPSAGHYGKANQAHGRFKEAQQQRKVREIQAGVQVQGSTQKLPSKA